MKKIKRISIVLIALGLVVSLTMVLPASAQTGTGNVKVLDSEFVLCTMDPTGEIDGVQVFDWLSLNGDGTTTVREKAAFDDIGSYQGVKGFTTPSVEDGYIVWPEISVDKPMNVIASTKLSESDVEEAKTRIPLDVRFNYWFDGVPVTNPGTLTGKSGRFKMELTMTNTSAEETVIEYEDPATGEMVTDEVETYLPLVILPYDWYFDNSVFFNLEADPTGLIVNMPDFYNVGWSIPLFPPATEDSHTIWVAADVENFQMPPLTLAVAFTFPETNQADPLELLGPALVQIYDGMKDVAEGIGTPDAADTLLYGITAVDDGINQLAAGLPEAVGSINSQMIPGVDQMVAGIGSPTTPDTLLFADAAAISGLQGITAGIGGTTTENTLLYAVNAIAGGLNGINAGIGSVSTPNTLLYAVGAVIAGLTNSDPANPGILQALQQMKAGLDAPFPDGIISGLQYMHDNIGPASTAGTLLNQIDQMIALFSVDNFPTPPPGATMYAYVNNNAAYGGAMNAQDLTVMNGYMSTLTANLTAGRPDIQLMYDSLGTPGDDTTIIGGLTYMSAGMGQMIAGIGSTTTPDTLLYAMAAIQGGLLGIQAGIGSPTTPDTLLFAVQAVEAGLNEIKGGIGDAGVPDTLLYALAAIQNGLYQIKGGLATGNMSDPGIREGLMLLSAGIEEAIAGLGTADTPDTLAYGSNAVASGLTELGDGAGQLEAGLGMVVETLNMSEAELEVIKMRGEEFDHFLGRAEGEKNEVRFVYQSEATYNYETGNTTSWIVAIIISVIIALALIAGGILLARRGEA